MSMASKLKAGAVGFLRVLGILVIIGLAFGGGYLLIRYRGFVAAAIITTMFLAGLATMPLLAYGVPLGKIGGETVGNMLLFVACASYGTSAINQTVDDGYEWISPDADELAGEPSFWERLAAVRFGITYDREPDAFADYADDFEYDRSVVADGSGPTHVAADSARGDQTEFIDLDVPEDHFVVAWGEKLHEMKESSSLDAGLKAKASALVEYGGDTSEYSPWAMLVGSAFFLLTGIALSLVIFT